VEDIMNLNRTEIFLLATSAGLLGATLALVLAPQSGRKTRREVRRVAGTFTDRAKDLRRDIKERMEDLVKEWREQSVKGVGNREDLRKNLLQGLRNSRDLISSKIARIEQEVQE
jgi:gas vesicle protein